MYILPQNLYLPTYIDMKCSLEVGSDIPFVFHYLGRLMRFLVAFKINLFRFRFWPKQFRDQFFSQKATPQFLFQNLSATSDLLIPVKCFFLCKIFLGRFWRRNNEVCEFDLRASQAKSEKLMFISTTKLKIKYKGGSPGHWLSEETLNQKVVSLNPGAGYCMDICHINLLHNCNVWLKRLKIEPF